MIPETHVAQLELPAGYSITEKLGAGGYGEVWRAEAPGGVQKAIKVVFGHYEEELAERELKSLDRIKNVRHPFVLSLERYEIVGGRLVIVTELADCSLDDCFQLHREQGLAGVPRRELLGYLSDAAEALDCLAERHALQHLDIKPENLLLVGDHVKVADFGLVKEFEERTIHSMIGGMTPLYSAPEIFDDAPSARSDQYSLAIVYQQMLTGILPFPGRTPAQLAKQHTQARPNLQPLDACDRPIVARALSKDPAARYDSCRKFLAALLAAGDSRESPADDPPQVGSANSAPAGPTDGATMPRPEVQPDDTESHAGLQTKPVDGPRAGEAAAPQTQPPPEVERNFDRTRIESTVDPYPLPNAEIADVAVPPQMSATCDPPAPTLYVGVGGIGIRMLQRIRSSLTAATEPQPVPCNWLAIDTDRESLAAVADDRFRVSDEHAIHIPLRRPKQYRHIADQMLQWVSRRWLYNIPRSLETRGYRPLGRIAMVDHAERVIRGLESQLASLAAAATTAPRVVFLTGMSGGTGGGTVIDLAQAARSLADDMGIALTVHAILAVTCKAAGETDSLAAANMVSLITELNHVQQFGNCGAKDPSAAAVRFESSAAPFDDLKCVVMPSREFRTREATPLGIGECYTADAVANVFQYFNGDPGTALSAGEFSWQSLGVGLPRRLAAAAETKLETDDELAAAMLQDADADILQCGYRRRSILFVPVSETTDEMGDALQRLRPTLAIVPVDVPEPILISVGRDLSPLHLAARLAETFPDVDQAAHRLHARSDLAWRDLRAVG